MTLRVYIDIIPHGEESEAYELHQIDIHNLGQTAVPGNCEYSFEIDGNASEEIVRHDRSDGPLALVARVLTTDTARELYDA